MSTSPEVDNVRSEVMAGVNSRFAVPGDSTICFRAEAIVRQGGQIMSTLNFESSYGPVLERVVLSLSLYILVQLSS